jgi:hypothetical protein
VVGSATIGQTFMIWQRYRKIVIKRYGYFLLSLFLVVLGFLSDRYTRMTLLSDFREAQSIIWIFHSLFGLSPASWLRIVFFIVDALTVIAVLTNIAVPAFLPAEPNTEAAENAAARVR